MSKTPYTKAHAIPASTGFGVDDYCDNYVPEEKVAALELAANGLAKHLERLVSRSFCTCSPSWKCPKCNAKIQLKEFAALQPKEPHE